MRVSLGGGVDVTTTERWLSEVRQGRAFGGNCSATGVVGEFAHAQLFNPAGSSITILVFLVELSSTAAGAVDITHHNTALTTDVVTKRNLLSGGAAPTGETRVQSSAVRLGNLFATVTLPANDVRRRGPFWVTELSAGEGVVIAAEVTATQLLVDWWWVEVPA